MNEIQKINRKVQKERKREEASSWGFKVASTPQRNVKKKGKKERETGRKKERSNLL